MNSANSEWEHNVLTILMNHSKSVTDFIAGGSIRTVLQCFCLIPCCCFITGNVYYLIVALLTLHLFCSSAEAWSRPFRWWWSLSHPLPTTWFLSWCELLRNNHLFISLAPFLFWKTFWKYSNVHLCPSEY